MVFILLPIGMVLGFFLALGLMVAMSAAAKRADDEARRDRLRGVYRREKLGERARR